MGSIKVNKQAEWVQHGSPPQERKETGVKTFSLLSEPRKNSIPSLSSETVEKSECNSTLKSSKASSTNKRTPSRDTSRIELSTDVPAPLDKSSSPRQSLSAERPTMFKRTRFPPIHPKRGKRLLKSRTHTVAKSDEKTLSITGTEECGSASLSSSSKVNPSKSSVSESNIKTDEEKAIEADQDDAEPCQQQVTGHKAALIKPANRSGINLKEDNAKRWKSVKKWFVKNARRIVQRVRV